MGKPKNKKKLKSSSKPKWKNKDKTTFCLETRQEKAFEIPVKQCFLKKNKNKQKGYFGGCKWESAGLTAVTFSKVVENNYGNLHRHRKFNDLIAFRNSSPLKSSYKAFQQINSMTLGKNAVKQKYFHNRIKKKKKHL